MLVRVLLLSILVPSYALGHNLGPDPSQACPAILGALNGIRDSVVNPLLANTIPAKIGLNVGTSGKSSAGCIIPSPFGCICHADAKYSVSLNSVQGLNGIKITNFSSCAIKILSGIALEVDLGAAFVLNNAKCTGGAHASVSACHISPSASGSVNTEANGVGSVAIAAKGALNLTDTCVNITNVNKVTVGLSALKLHDEHVKISLGPIPGVDIGKLTGLVFKLVPSLTGDIKNAITGPISSALTKVLQPGALPCIPIPHMPQLASDGTVLDWALEGAAQLL